jgi:hypothetical protein
MSAVREGKLTLKEARVRTGLGREKCSALAGVHEAGRTLLRVSPFRGPRVAKARPPTVLLRPSLLTPGTSSSALPQIARARPKALAVLDRYHFLAAPMVDRLDKRLVGVASGPVLTGLEGGGHRVAAAVVAPCNRVLRQARLSLSGLTDLYR